MTTVPGGGRGDAGDRPGGAGDDAVAGRDLRAGRVHGRHRRPLHESFGLTMAFAIMVSLLVSFTLTPMLAARWLKVKPHGKDQHALEGLEDLPRRSTRSTRGCSSGRWRTAAIVAGVAVLVLLSSVPLFMVANKNFLPQDDQAEFEINLRAARRHEPRDRPRCIANRIANAVRAAAAGGRLHAGHDRRRPGEDAQPRHRLRAADADRSARSAISSRSWTTIRKRRSCRRSRPASAHLGAAGRGHRRRRRRRTPTCSSSSTGPT